jgi:hypothetical protein
MVEPNGAAMREMKAGAQARPARVEPHAHEGAIRSPDEVMGHGGHAGHAGMSMNAIICLTSADLGSQRVLRSRAVPDRDQAEAHVRQA